MASQAPFQHRPAPHGPPPSRLEEVLAHLKHEVDLVNADSANLKVQNMEYESHTNSHTQEVTALRVSLTELEREHDRLRKEFEAENQRLRQELEAARNGQAPPQPRPSSAASAAPPALAPPQIGHGPANLFGGIMGGATSGPPMPGSSHAPPVGLPGPTASAPTGADGHPLHSANGLSRDREFPPFDHPSKRARVDEKPPYEQNGAQQHGPPHAGSSRGPHMAPLDTRPPHLSLARTTATPDRRTSPGPGTPGSANPIDMDPSRVPATLKNEGSDWAAIFNPKVKRELNVELVHSLTHDSVVCCVRFSPDGKLLATGCNRNVNIYDTTTGAKKHVLTEETPAGKTDNYIRSACFSPDGKYIATGSEDKLVRIWDIERKEIRATFEGHKSEIYSLAFSPDGNWLVSGSGDRSAHIWDVRNRSLRHTLPIDDLSNGDVNVDAGVTSVAISPDGNLVAAGSLDTVVRVWDLHTGTILDRLRAHRDSVYSVAFAPDGKWLVSGSLDKTLKIWDLSPLRNRTSKGEASNGMQVDDEPTEGKVLCVNTLVGHKDYVLSVAVAADGNYIVSGSKDRSVCFWNPSSPSAAVVLQGHKNSVISIGVADKGGLLATGSGDWSCKIWRMTRLANEA